MSKETKQNVPKVQKEKLTKEENRRLVIKIIVLSILGIGFILSFIFYSKIFGEKSVFNKSITDLTLINSLYNKIPQVIRSFQIVVISIVVFKIIKFLMNKSFSKSNRGITILKLLENCMKWVIAIVSFLMVLAAFGVDTATLLASAGILTLVIGLGVQSLVADIVAGIFIVIEGEFQVGDIVVIDGWRGTVKEIGIRVTKITDAGGNIKIINNSEIRSIVNQTQDLSVAKCTMSIDYDESVPRVELIIRDNIETIKKNIPAIIEGPFYKGVSELGDSSVNLLFLAKCKEEDIYQVQRDLNRELYLLFNKENISIPYNQVVISERNFESSKTTLKMSKEANSFTMEQKELSKSIKEEENN